MGRRALIFPEPDALVATMEANLIAADVLAKAVDYQSLDDGVLAVAPGRSLDSKTMTKLGKLGIEIKSLEGDWLEAACWPALLAPSPISEDERPNSCLFALSDDGSILDLVAELLRLGCDRASFATLKTKGNGSIRGLVRAFAPPYYTIIRGTGPGAPFVPFVPVRQGGESVWIEFGFQHRLATSVRPKGDGLLLIRSDGTWSEVAPGEWTDVLELADIEVGGAARTVAGTPLEEKLVVRLKLRDASRDQSPTLWVISDEPEAQVEALLASSPDDVIARLLFAVGEIGDQSVVLIRARPGRGAPPQIDLRGTAFVPYAGISNLHVPINAAIEPPLRRDTLREELAPDPSQVVWAVPTGSEHDFGLESIDESAFCPLADWVDYVVAEGSKELEAWLGGVTFETEAFRSIGTEWSAASKRAEEPAPKPKRRRARQESVVEEVEEQEELPAMPMITEATPTLAALPEISYGGQSIEQQLAEIEREFLDDDAPADAPSRAPQWLRMARLHAELGQNRDASLCLLRALWEAPDSQVTGLAGAWFAAAGDQSALADIIKFEHPTLDQMRSAVAQLTQLSAAGATLPVDSADAQHFLDSHDADLDVRSIWLGRTSLSRAVGGDRLALARARDRLLRQMRGGLSLERDVPTFLRFLGAGGGDSAAVGELTRHLEALLAYSRKVKRGRSPVEAPVEITQAYVDLEFAYAFARLGQPDSARQLRDAATEVVPKDDAVHQFLARAYSARVDQALEGKPPASPLPPEVSAALNDLSKFERYKVDRLRQASTVLEPQERLDPVAAFQRGDADPRGEEFAALRGMHDVGELGREIRRLLGVSTEAGTSLEDRARLLDGLMDFFPLLPEAEAISALDTVLGAVGDVEPKSRALLLEEALMLAGFFGREHSSRAIATDLEALLGELPSADVISLAAEFGACLRSLRRVGLADRAKQLLERLSSAIVGDGTDVVLARLQVASGRAYLGGFEQVESVLADAHELVTSGQLVPAERLRIIRGLASTWTHAPTERAAEGLRELAKLLPSITDSYNTNSHFCLSVLAFVDAIVLGFATGELALGDVGRRWLDEDEYLVRRRIHRELEQA